MNLLFRIIMVMQAFMAHSVDQSSWRYSELHGQAWSVSSRNRGRDIRRNNLPSFWGGNRWTEPNWSPIDCGDLVGADSLTRMSTAIDAVLSLFEFRAYSSLAQTFSFNMLNSSGSFIQFAGIPGLLVKFSERMLSHEQTGEIARFWVGISRLDHSFFWKLSAVLSLLFS